MSKLRTLLIQAAAGAGLAVLTTTTVVAEEKPNLKDLTTGAETLIGDTDAQQDLRGIQYRFERLANDAETRAKYLAIKEILPAVEEDIETWRFSAKDQRPAFPTSENIGKLQDLLGITGDDRDKRFGPQVARSLSYLGTTPIGRFGDDELPRLDIESYRSLSAHVSDQAPKAYNYYLEQLGESQAEAVKAVTRELADETDRAAKLTELAFESCTGEQIAIDKDQFVRNFVKALDTEGGDINAAIGKGCEDILVLAKTPEEREALLASLKENLADDITAMREVIMTEREDALLRSLIAKRTSAEIDNIQEDIRRDADKREPTP